MIESINNFLWSVPAICVWGSFGALYVVLRVVEVVKARRQSKKG